MDANLIYVDASERFLKKLENVSDPEQKRKIIGAEFIRVFEEEARKLEGIDFLAQGTIYPDIVESGTKTAKVVKSHHNVGGLPEDLKFSLVEPLYHLFKDEVRACGIELRPAGSHGLQTALSRPGTWRALPRCHHQRTPGSSKRIRCYFTGRVCLCRFG
jgi:GMP synthase (glutamine-hydrolysing) B subunit